MSPTPNDFHRSTALVTGASSGIGEAFARALAARGASLVLVARSERKLRALAEELAEAHGVRAEVVATDLTRPGAAADLAREVARRGIDVDVLVNNAGFGTYGRFETLPPERERDEIQLNVVALVDLTHALLPGMLARGRGAVLNVASTAAFQPVPWMAVYGATKAFVLSFSEALWAETRGRGISVLAVCPGRTDTSFSEALGAGGAEAAGLGRAETADVVVGRALRALAHGRTHVVSGARNCLTAQLPRFLPRAITARVAGLVMRPRRAAGA